MRGLDPAMSFWSYPERTVKWIMGRREMLFLIRLTKVTPPISRLLFADYLLQCGQLGQLSHLSVLVVRLSVVPHLVGRVVPPLPFRGHVSVSAPVQTIAHLLPLHSH